VRPAAERPRILVAAGLDPSGRAGLLADVAAVLAAGGRPWGVATALTAQASRFHLSAVAGGTLAKQLDAVLELGRPAAVKLGMVPDRRTLRLVWARVARSSGPLVVDPVVRTSRGEQLSTLLPGDYRRLAGPGVWIVPNVPELGWLVGRAAPRSLDEVKVLAASLLADGFEAVVVKGGHLAGAPVDVLVVREKVVTFRGVRLARPKERRGTGCRFASTLVTRLAMGDAEEVAVRTARRAVRRFLAGG
jgi:hydroxymethylpyrimidine/phosphomethylpyrimidine kinase